MCIILDANCFSKFQDPANQDMEPVRKWFRKNGKIVYAPTDQFRQEWAGTGKRKQLRTWKQAGKLKEQSPAEVESEANKLQDKIKSDDPHVIALAKVAGVKVLVSHDKNLHQDFTNPEFIEQGKVYQSKSHRHLLKPDLCP